MGRVLTAALLVAGFLYFAAQCVLAAIEPGDGAWTIGYLVFALIFALLAGGVLVSIVFGRGAASRN